ncbi:MAG: hypothetical protein H6540_05305 [Bacteroidales bacterium]|nr:hypothetical protein [Bacteroidales bacterium]
MELNGQIIRNFYLNNSNGIFTYHDILEKDSFPLLSSILIRNDRSMLRPFFKGELKARDIILILIVLEKGNAYYMNDVMSCRRIQNTGVWASLDGYEKLKVQINIRKEYLKYYKNHYYSSSLSKNLINKLFLLNKLLLKKRKAFKLISNSLAIFYYSIRFRQIKFSVRKTLYAIIK